MSSLHISPFLHDALCTADWDGDLANYRLVVNGNLIDLEESKEPSNRELMDSIHTVAMEKLIEMVFLTQDWRKLITIRDRIRQVDHLILEPINAKKWMDKIPEWKESADYDDLNYHIRYRINLFKSSSS